ncbi:hypothetical protein D6827_00425, partial [Candidatus Parcubacteria bacterium]
MATTREISPVQRAEDSAHSAGDSFVPVGGYRKDAGGTPVNADGDYHPLLFDANGNLYVRDSNAATESTLSSIDSKITACNTGAVVVSGGSISVNGGTIELVGAGSNTWTINASGDSASAIPSGSYRHGTTAEFHISNAPAGTVLEIEQTANGSSYQPVNGYDLYGANP